jgi:hypothetical protein
MHRSQQDCTCKFRRPQKEHSCRDICTIGIAQRDRRCDAIARAGIGNDKSASSLARRRTSSSSKTPSANLRKKRGMPFSKTLPRGESNDAVGAIMRASGIRSFSSPPVP